MTRAATNERATVDLAGLRKHRDAAETKYRQFADELHGVRALTSPYVDDKPAASRAEVLRARAREPQLRADVALAEAELDEVAVELREAEHEERRRAQAQARENLKPFIPRLHAKLDDVVELLEEMIPLDDAALVGVTTAFRLLIDEPHREGLLSMSRHFCEQEQLLPE